MIKKESRQDIREKKHLKIRKRINGTAEMPRLAVFRSNHHIYAQLIDDVAGKTLASASTMDKDLKGQLKVTDNVEAAEAVGEAVAKKALDQGIKTVVFDRAGYIYHGKVAAVADAARKAGLEF